MDVVAAMHSWRSVREYRPDPIAREVIVDLLWHAVQVPSPPGAGVESRWAFAVLEGFERIESYGLRAMDYAREHRPPGASGWSWTERTGFRVFWGAPAVVLICGRNDDAAAPFDCCRAGQNLLLAAHARGLGTCWVGAPLPWLQSPGVAAELDLPAGYEPTVAMLLGHPARPATAKSRPPPDVTWCA